MGMKRTGGWIPRWADPTCVGLQVEKRWVMMMMRIGFAPRFMNSEVLILLGGGTHGSPFDRAVSWRLNGELVHEVRNVDSTACPREVMVVMLQLGCVVPGSHKFKVGQASFQ